MSFMKFGGSSRESAGAIQRLPSIVRDHRDRQPDCACKVGNSEVGPFAGRPRGQVPGKWRFLPLPKFMVGPNAINGR
jgi:hypothetical protein